MIISILIYDRYTDIMIDNNNNKVKIEIFLLSTTKKSKNNSKNVKANKEK